MKSESTSTPVARSWSARVALARDDAPSPRDPGPLLRAARAAAFTRSSAPAAEFAADFVALFGARPALAGSAAIAAAALSLAATQAASEWHTLAAWVDLVAISGGLFS